MSPHSRSTLFVAVSSCSQYCSNAVRPWLSGRTITLRRSLLASECILRDTGLSDPEKPSLSTHRHTKHSQLWKSSSEMTEMTDKRGVGSILPTKKRGSSVDIVLGSANTCTSLLVESNSSLIEPGTGVRKTRRCLGADKRIIARMSVLFPDPVSPTKDITLGNCRGGFSTVSDNRLSRRG
jgi:hypothetical protein